MISVLGVVGLGAPVGATPAASSGTATNARTTATAIGPGTPLPAGWELCVLAGIGAPGTPDNVANLDEWQVAEGGSTDNAAAYNPFNTRQMTDSTGAALPIAGAPGGFPAFKTWTAGCAATVATLLQSTMAPIVTALQVGDLAPPGVFLAAVDETPWCAPSADGVPCYASEVLAGELLRALLGDRSAQVSAVLTSYSATGTDLLTYEKAAYVTAVEDGIVAARTAQLEVAEQQLATAQRTLASTTRALRRFALDSYMNDTQMRFDSDFTRLGPTAEQDGMGQYLQNVAASMVIDKHDQAQAVVSAASAARRAAGAALATATATAGSASSAEGQALTALESDVTSLEGGLSCTLPTVTTEPPTSAAKATGTASHTAEAPSTTTTTTTTAPAAPTPTTPSTPTDPTTPVSSPSSAGQLWQGLQACLTPSTGPGTLASTSAP